MPADTLANSCDDGLESVEDEGRDDSKSEIFTVTDALMLAKGALEGLVIKVVGELSEVNAKRGYKAVYFTVKDERSSLPCLIWMSRYQKLDLDLQVGQVVEMVGRFTLYAAKGRMSFEAFSIKLAGEGDLRMRVDRLAKKLQAQGLMDPARKMPIPEYPAKIGVVTSPRGAAVHDVLRTLRRRFPLAEVLLAGVPVEGAMAPHELMMGLRCVYDAGAEVVLLVRGGGSFEDLMPFNDEKLAITISRCPIPVVTGIGHEPDTTIADMVADVRASTPTAAAETVSPSPESLDALFKSLEFSLADPVRKRLSALELKLETQCARPVFSDPMYLTSEVAQGLDLASLRLNAAIPKNLERDKATLAQRRVQLKTGLDRVCEGPLAQVSAQRMRLQLVGPRIVSTAETELVARASRLHDLSPLSTLGRGYAMARDEAGTVVSKVEQVSPDMPLEVMVSNGIIDCTVVDAHVIETEVEEWKVD